jgi:arginase
MASELRNKRKVGLIGIPLGFAAGKGGSEMGVTAIRHADVRGKRLIDHIESLGFSVVDHGDIEIFAPRKLPDQKTAGPNFLDEVVENSNRIAREISKFARDELLIILGGDHSIAIATVNGIASANREHNEEIGLVWFDAHADMNTSATSPSGNIHGMPLAALLGFGDERLTKLCGFSPVVNPKYLAHVGGRDFDQGEKEIIEKLDLRDHFFTMSDIDQRGMAQCVEEAVAIASRASGGFAATFDVDILDPRFAPGSGTLVRGGITYREAHLALEIIAKSDSLRSFEIVEVNPTLDTANITVELAVELILSALGKTIL